MGEVELPAIGRTLLSHTTTTHHSKCAHRAQIDVCFARGFCRNTVGMESCPSGKCLFLL
ncbi:hypothetical protein M407DRAFT_160415 [Tulasnella calospora MUT 4182]|uniref:Uncharacterized protein n=1 Tax=Tulasnella calospora MUT 4182 TaxID=1051891 RepID=A0A0C3PU45_9AGAM|nr:hypothetical protein M407DRAFT_160415 [Tulasnella calospora MUT 4182]